MVTGSRISGSVEIPGSVMTGDGTAPLSFRHAAKAFIQHRLGPLAPPGSLLIEIAFRALQADRCPLKGQMRPHMRSAFIEIAPQKIFARPLQGALSAEVSQPQPLKTNEHPR